MSIKWLALTLLLVIIMGAAGAFGGYTYGHAAGLNDAQNIRNQFFAARGINPQGGTGGLAGGAGGTGGAGALTGAGGGQGTGRQSNANNFASGQVKVVNADSIELSTATEVLKVQVTTDTQIQKTVSAKLSDLQPGERVTIEGTPNSDGTFTAQAIQVGGNAFGGGRTAQNGGAGQAAGGGRSTGGGAAGGAAGTPAATSQP